MGKVIVLADDSVSIRQMAAMTLAQNGYDVVQAVDGRDALQQLFTYKVDMLITDLNMPKIGGIGLIKGARAMPPCKLMPIIMLTNAAQDSKKQEGKAAGATGWLAKPFKPEQLLAVVKKVLG